MSKNAEASPLDRPDALSWYSWLAVRLVCSSQSLGRVVLGLVAATDRPLLLIFGRLYSTPSCALNSATEGKSAILTAQEHLALLICWYAPVSAPDWAQTRLRTLGSQAINRNKNQVSSPRASHALENSAQFQAADIDTVNRDFRHLRAALSSPASWLPAAKPRVDAYCRRIPDSSQLPKLCPPACLFRLLPSSSSNNAIQVASDPSFHRRENCNVTMDLRKLVEIGELASYYTVRSTSLAFFNASHWLPTPTAQFASPPNRSSALASHRIASAGDYTWTAVSVVTNLAIQCLYACRVQRGRGQKTAHSFPC